MAIGHNTFSPVVSDVNISAMLDGDEENDKQAVMDKVAKGIRKIPQNYKNKL